MKHFLVKASAIITVVAFMAAANASAVQAANYTGVTIRIEAPDKSILNKTIYLSDAGCTVTDSANVKHVLSGDNALCALQTASEQYNIDFAVQNSSFGLFLNSIDTYVGDSQYWTYYVNDVEGAVGASEYDLEDGDQLLFVYGDYGMTSPLQLTVNTMQPTTEKEIVATVRYKSGETYLPMSNATVFFGKTAVTTNTEGKATFTRNNAGRISVYATATGYTKTPVKKLTVHAVKAKRQAVNFDQRLAQSKNGLAYIKKQMNKKGIVDDSQATTEWSAMALATAGESNAALNAAVKKYQPTSAEGTSEIARHILALEAIGENSKNTGKINFVNRLTGTKSNNQYGSAAYCNDDIFAGLALLAADVKKTSDDMKDAVNGSLPCQNADGGLSYAVTGDSDVDTTAAWIMLASKLRTENSYYKELLNTKYTKAVAFLRTAQNPDGGFGYEPGQDSNSSSTAWAMMAFSAQGREAGSVMKNNENGFSYLKKTYGKDGSYAYDTIGSDSVESLNSAYAIIAQNRKAFPVNQ